jgi:DNA-binding transcriptional ArsR family regulator
LYIVFLRNILRFIAILLKAVFHGYRRHSQGLGQSGSPRDSRVAEGARSYFSEQAFPLVNGVCAGQIDARCDMSQSTVSAHLATLHKAGLVTSKRVGQWIFFKRDEAVIQAFLDQLHNGL